MRVTTTAVGTRSVLALVAVFVLHAYRCHSLKSLVSGTRFAYDTVVIPSRSRQWCGPIHATHRITYVRIVLPAQFAFANTRGYATASIHTSYYLWSSIPLCYRREVYAT